MSRFWTLRFEAWLHHLDPMEESRRCFKSRSLEESLLGAPGFGNVHLLWFRERWMDLMPHWNTFHAQSHGGNLGTRDSHMDLPWYLLHALCRVRLDRSKRGHYLWLLYPDIRHKLSRSRLFGIGFVLGWVFLFFVLWGGSIPLESKAGEQGEVTYNRFGCVVYSSQLLWRFVHLYRLGFGLWNHLRFLAAFFPRNLLRMT